MALDRFCRVCYDPPFTASDEEYHQYMDCVAASVKSARAARDAMAARLLELYLIFDGEGDKRLDASQKAWRARTDGLCPPITNDLAVILDSSTCEEQRHIERSNLLDDVVAGCRAGACPVDKL